MHSKSFKAISLIALMVICLAPTVLSRNSPLPETEGEKAISKKKEPVELSQDLSVSQVDRIVAGLSDEQVRRLLIDELKMQARRDNLAQPKQEGIAGFIEKIKDFTVLLQTRIEFLRSGGRDSSGQGSGI